MLFGNDYDIIKAISKLKKKVININRSDILKLSPTELYKLVIQGKKIKRFPNGFLNSSEAINNSIEVTKFLVEDILNWNDNDIKERMGKNTFHNHKLGGMLSIIYQDNPILAIMTAYPNRFKEWEFNKVSRKFWNLETCASATKWLIEEKLNWSKDELLQNISKKTFIDNGFSGMLTHLHPNLTVYAIINLVYPNQYKPWEFMKVEKDYWTLDTAKEATKWLVEDKLQLRVEDIKKCVKKEIFLEYGLTTMLNYLFNNSVKKAVENAYPCLKK